jgi:NAD(P)H-nitrite reductase large subunit
MRLLVIGGSDAGIAAALRARELNPSAEVTVVVADAFPNFSICGLPCYLSDDVPDWRDLAHRTTADPEQAGLRLLLDHTDRAIDPAAKQVTVSSQRGEQQLGYDRLVIGTGAVPVRPPIDGLHLPEVHVLHTMGDTFALHQVLAVGARSAVIVGVATSAWKWPRPSPPAAWPSPWSSRPRQSCPPSIWNSAGCWAKSCAATTSTSSMTSPSRASTKPPTA